MSETTTSTDHVSLVVEANRRVSEALRGAPAGDANFLIGAMTYWAPADVIKAVETLEAHQAERAAKAATA